MATVKPFKCIRPKKELAGNVAALPYDVYNRKEALDEVKKEPLSFLKIDRAETQLGEDVGTYDDCVYEKAKETLTSMIKEGIFITESSPCYYLYELTMGQNVQTGIVACSSVDDYINGVVKRHENTREDKELDRIRHVDVLNAQTGPIFLAYRARTELKELAVQVKKEKALYDFTSIDGIRHRVFRIAEQDRIKTIAEVFSFVPCTYIADGHHRAASAVKVALKRRTENPDYTGNEEFNYFLSVLFPDDELLIMPYNRVVKDLNGLTESDFLRLVSERFDAKACGEQPEDAAGKEIQYAPKEKGVFYMLLGKTWYELKAKKDICTADPVKGLDVSILQEHLLGPILGIGDPRTDKRIEFIGGIRGISGLESRIGTDMAVAFSLYPTSMEELLRVADAGLLMPPKSTWFEPKLRSGLFIHSLLNR